MPVALASSGAKIIALEFLRTREYVKPRKGEIPNKEEFRAENEGEKLNDGPDGRWMDG